ncbi:MAG: FtsH protease activity modulator HflK [Myxococcota bacterium]|nr:FtsH protease activity modulator HflK [Myxococcota bacterium]
MRRLLGLGGVIGLLLAAWSSVMLVDADEVAVVYRLGAVSRTASAGLSLRLPAPIERDERVQVTEVRRVEPGQRILLTGDTNLVVVDLVAQYTVSDPVAFSINLIDPEAVIADALRGETAAQVSGMKVDVLLTTGRGALQQQIKTATQSQLDALAVGAALDAVELRALEPPDAVVAAFNDVSSARGDRDTMILAAQSYASRHIPDVRGQAAQLSEGARAEAADMVAEARADVKRFDGLVKEWRRAPEALRRGLVAEAAGEIEAEVRMVRSGDEVILE